MLKMKNGNETLTFHMIDHNVIQKNRPIGKVVLKLQDVLGSQGTVMELPIDTGGVLCFFIRRYPIASVPAGLPPSLQFSRQKLLLDRFVHFQGETIRGMFIWNLSKPKTIGSIQFQLFGRIGSMGEHARESIGPGTRLLDQQSHLNDIKELPAGSNIFPFEYLLPKRMPTSTWDNIFGIKHYHVNIIVFNKNGSEMTRLSKQIAILPDLDKLTPRWCTLYQNYPVPPPPENFVIKFDVSKVLFFDQPIAFKVYITSQGTQVSLQDFSISLWSVVVTRSHNPDFSKPDSWWAFKWHRMAKKVDFDETVKMTTGQNATIELVVKLQFDYSEYNAYHELQPTIPPETYPELGESYNFLELKAKDHLGCEQVLGTHPVFVTYSKYYRTTDFILPPIDIVPKKFHVARLQNDPRSMELNAPATALIVNSAKHFRLFDDHSVDPYDRDATKFALAPGVPPKEFAQLPRLQTEDKEGNPPPVQIHGERIFAWPELPCPPELIKQIQLPKDTGKLNPY
jgi:hypothetical protein